MTKLKQSMKVLRFVAQLAVASQLAVSLAAAQTPGSIAIDCDQAAVNLRWSSVTGRSYMVYGTSQLTSLWSEVETVPKPLVATSNQLSYSLTMPTNQQFFYRVGELPEDNFQIEVTTTTSPQNFICRFVNPGTLHVDWGNGSANDYNATINVTNTYATAGVYTVRMSGTVGLIDFFIYPDPGLGTPKLITAIKTPVRGITGLNSAYEMFKHCENITTIPAGLFDNCPGITRFYDTFLACRKITSIPLGLFDAQKNVNNFYATFDNCDLITSVPVGLFNKHTNNMNFAWTFAKCYALSDVPESVFNTHRKNLTFDHVFFRCYALSSLSSSMFTNNPLVTTFANAFSECRALSSIPPGLFNGNPAVTTFANAFYGCTNLTSFPSDLFAKNTNVTSYASTFQGCMRLTGASPTNSAGQKLWELTPPPTGTACFRNCTNLTDYATIPAEWK
jgi:hypothetical protein